MELVPDVQGQHMQHVAQSVMMEIARIEETAKLK
jgi:hypothetical protein